MIKRHTFTAYLEPSEGMQTFALSLLKYIPLVDKKYSAVSAPIQPRTTPPMLYSVIGGRMILYDFEVYT